MTKAPALATVLLNRLGPRDESLVGDLHEEYATGRSRAWFWRQVMAAMAFGAAREIRRAPGRTIVAVMTGWAVAAAVFLRGDRIAGGLAGFFWQWSREKAYADDIWWPFYITALCVTYVGFGLSAVVVARVNHHRPAMLLAYVVSTFTVLSIAGLVLEILVVQQVAVPLPHPLFYAVFTTLPFLWHSGIVLVPLTMLVCGMMATTSRVRACESSQ